MSSFSSSSSSSSPPSLASPPPPPAPPPAVYPPFLDPSLSVRRPTRVVMHVDMDCFYASVESQRFPHFLDHALGVIQNGTLCVTTNYRCRVRGLPKMGAPADFASLCPSMRFAGSDMVRYRAASRQWHRVFTSFTGVTVMKRSIDEAYLDLTAVVRQRIRQRGLLTPVPHSDPESLRLIAQRRHEAADCAWREEEAKLQQRFGSIAPHLLESSGTITAAVRASKSTDPISQLREQQRQAITGGGMEDYRRGKMRLDPALEGRTEEELAAIGTALHPVHFCRAQKAQTAAMELQPNSDDSRRRVRGTPGFKWAPWVGEVFLSGEEEEAKEDAAAAEEELQVKDATVDAAETGEEAAVDEDTQDITTLHAALSSSSLRPPPVDFSLEDPESPSDDYLLCVGSQLAFEIRQRLFLQMGLTTSAGIAPNPMLAKLASSLHKPNQQSVVRRSIVQSFLAPIKLSKVSGFGPKASERVAAAGVCFVSDVQRRSYASLVSEFGSRFGSWLWSIGQGEDETPVEETGPPKSIGQSKRQRTSTEDEKLNLLYWLASKLYERIDEDELYYARFPSSLALGWINIGTWDIISRRVSIPYLREKTDPVQFMYEQSIALLKEHVPAAATLRCLSLTASNFIPLPSAKNISSYFKQTAEGAEAEERKDSRAEDGSSSSAAVSVPLTANPYVGPSFTARYKEAKQKVKKKSGKSPAASLLARPGKERTIDTFTTLVERRTDRQAEQAELSLDAEDDIAELFGQAEDSSQSMLPQPPPSPSLPPLERPTAAAAAASSPQAAAAPQPVASAPPAVYPCSVCGQPVLETARAEHEDYHYALSLQSAVRSADRKQREEEDEKRRHDRLSKKTKAAAALRPSPAASQRGQHAAGQGKKISAFFPMKDS